MDGNNLITAFQNGLPVLSKVGPIVGAIFTAIFFRKNIRDAEFEKLKAGKFQEVADKLLEAGYMTYTEYYKASNFLHVAELADKVFKKDFKNTAANNQKYDFDWFMRFYDIVGNVSDSDMQTLWAKILAGEIHQKGTYSLRLLDILKNFTQKEGKLFDKVCSHCLISGSNVFIPNYTEYLKLGNITYQDILDLDDLGLLNSRGDILLTAQMSSNGNYVMGNNKLYMMVKSRDSKNTAKEFTIKQFPFTAVGKELVMLTGKHASDKDFLIFIESVIKENADRTPFIITANRLVVENNSMRFEKINLDSAMKASED